MQVTRGKYSHCFHEIHHGKFSYLARYWIKEYTSFTQVNKVQQGEIYGSAVYHYIGL